MMDATVSKKDLLQAVSTSMEFVSTSNTAPLLKSVLIDTATTKDLLVNATDNERACRCRLDIGELKASGSAVLPAAGLRDFLNGASGSIVRITQEEKKVVCKSGTSRITFKLPGEYQYPPTALSDPCEEIFSMSATELAGLFSRTSFISKQGNTNAPDQGSVSLVGSYGVRLVANSTVSTVAYESARVSRVKSAVVPLLPCEYTLPPRAAQWLSSVRWGAEDTVTASRHNAGVVFTSGSLSVFFRTTNFPLPDMSSQFSPDFKFRAIFNTDALRHSLAAVGHFAEAEGAHSKFRRVTITLQDKEAALRAVSGVGEVEAEDSSWCSHNAPVGTVICFDPGLVLDFCKTQPSEKFQMKFNGPTGIFRFGHKGDDDFVYLAVAQSA